MNNTPSSDDSLTVLRIPSPADTNTPASRAAVSMSTGSVPARKGRLQPKTSRRSRAQAAPGRALTRAMVAGVGVMKAYPVAATREASRASSTLYEALSIARETSACG